VDDATDVLKKVDEKKWRESGRLRKKLILMVLSVFGVLVCFWGFVGSKPPHPQPPPHTPTKTPPPPLLESYLG